MRFNSAFKGLMEPGFSLPHSQTPATFPYPGTEIIFAKSSRIGCVTKETKLNFHFVYFYWRRL